MVDYVEFPTDLLTKVVLPKKPDDGEPPFEYGNNVPGPCGMYFFTLELTERLPDFMVLAPGGLYFLRPGVDEAGKIHVVWHYAGRYKEITDTVEGQKPYDWFEIADYMWQVPASWTITVVVNAFIIFEVTVNVFRNRDPKTFNPCVDTPDYFTTFGPGFASIDVEVLPQFPSENWPPMFTVVGAFTCAGSAPSAVIIQAHCKDETAGALPPQPKGFPTTSYGFMVKDMGEPTGNSWFLTNTNPAG